MGLMDSFRKRVGHGGISNVKSRIIADARRNFERSLKNDPSSVTTRITNVGEVNISEDTRLVDCVINDYSENDQKTYDEKVIYLRHSEEDIGIGSYVEFDGFIWLIIFREHRAANVYRCFIMRKCNQVIKYEHQGTIYDIPCIVKNLTQYSDGLQDIVYTSVPDARRSITYSDNHVTYNIKLGHRFLVNNSNAYRVTHIQDFEYQADYNIANGIATCIAVHTSLLNEDDTDNNIAFNEEVTNDTIMIGSNLSYNMRNCTWNIEYTSNKRDYVKVSNKEGNCTVSVDMDFDLIGETFKLRALDFDGDVVLIKDITVVGFI